ncbi:hypothetical protein B0H14DRAFT_2600370 [Mycena olivaceomarginata]|nr:hypothetical protein B0H14DRAFT_2600370 [Mycena olivaceomarginata]
MYLNPVRVNDLELALQLVRLAMVMYKGEKWDLGQLQVREEIEVESIATCYGAGAGGKWGSEQKGTWLSILQYTPTGTRKIRQNGRFRKGRQHSHVRANGGEAAGGQAGDPVV